MNECCMEKAKLTIKNTNDTTQLNYRFLHKNCEPVFAYLAHSWFFFAAWQRQ